MIADFELDWEAYFKAFCEKHGKPIEYAGRLLFPDGWMYSATDHAGPEWRPTKEPLRDAVMREAYHVERKMIIAEELRYREQALYNLMQLQTAKDIPLMRMKMMFDDERNVNVPTAVMVDFSQLEADVQQLKAELATCEEQLVKIQKEKAGLNNNGLTGNS